MYIHCVICYTHALASTFLQKQTLMLISSLFASLPPLPTVHFSLPPSLPPPSLLPSLPASRPFSLFQVIAVEKKAAEEGLAAALPALEEARLALDDLDKNDVTEIRCVSSASFHTATLLMHIFSYLSYCSLPSVCPYCRMYVLYLCTCIPLCQSCCTSLHCASFSLFPPSNLFCLSLPLHFLSPSLSFFIPSSLPPFLPSFIPSSLPPSLPPLPVDPLLSLHKQCRQCASVW